MKILINDRIQFETNLTSGAENVKKPDLISISQLSSFTFNIPSSDINCIAVGNTDCTSLQLTLGTNIIVIPITQTYPKIYYLSQKYTSITNVAVSLLTGSYIGRFALGEYRSVSIARNREPGIIPTESSEKTRGGQVVERSGGTSLRTIGFDLKNNIDSDIRSDVLAQRNKYIKGFPVFIDFSDESDWVDMGDFYGHDKNKWNLQNGSNNDLYTKKFNFEECF